MNKVLRSKFGFWFTTGLLMLTLLGNLFFIRYALQVNNQDAKVINLSGRQRMLSQKVSVMAFQYYYGQTTFAPVKQTLQEWHLSHRALLEGSDSLGVHPVEAPAEIAGLTELLGRVQTATALAPRLEKRDSVALFQLVDNQAQFLEGMDDLVFLMEANATHRLNQVVYTEGILLLLFLVVLWLEVRFSFYPLLARLQAKHNEALSKGNQLQSLMEWSQEGILFLDARGRLLDANVRALKMIRLSLRVHISKGEDFFPHIPDAMQEGFLKQFSKAVAGQKGQIELEVPVRNGLRWVLFTFDPTGSSDQLSRVVVRMLDIDARKRFQSTLEAQKQRMHDLTQGQTNALDSFLALVNSWLSAPDEPTRQALDLLIRQELPILMKEVEQFRDRYQLEIEIPSMVYYHR